MSETYKSYDKLNGLLERCKVEENQDYTHLSMGYPYGRFSIIGNDLEKFNKYYIKALDKDCAYHLLEKVQPHGPYIADFDFHQKSDKRIYDIELIKKIINYHHEEIKSLVKVSNNNLQVFLLEKKKPSKTDNDYKDGFHLMYPFICLKDNLRQIIRNRVIKKLNEENIFDKYEFNNKDVNKIYDNMAIEKGQWMLYGSFKPKNQKYLLTKIYSFELEELDLNMYSINELIEYCSIRKFNPTDENDYLIDNTLLEQEYKKIKGEINKDISILPLVSTSTLDEVRFLVSILDKSRSENYQDWIELGWCLHNIDKSLLDLWKDFSKNCLSKYNANECHKLWNKMKNNGFTIRSLHRWTKNDNYSKYQEYIDRIYNDKLHSSLTARTYDVAKAFITKYPDCYVYSPGCKSWYEFKEHRWHRIDKAYTIHSKIAEGFCNDLSKKAIEYHQKAINASGIEKEDFQKKASQYNELIGKLLNISYRNNIINELEHLYSDPLFREKLNENKDLLGFEDGVYDLAKKEFREGRPEDYITFSTKHKYTKHNPNNPHFKEFINILSQIQPNQELRDFLLLELSSYLDGYIREEKFHIWTGIGSNGKTLTVDLIMGALGDYATPLPITILIKKRNASNAASPELALMKGKRFGVFQEPEEGDKLHVGQLKELTGGDQFMARPLFEEPIIIHPQTKFVLTCNDLPTVEARDTGTWRRIRAVPFNSEFVDNPSKSNQYKIDRNLKHKMDEWLPVILAFLIDKYHYYREHGLKEPKQVKMKTNEYQQSSDYFYEFFSENIVESKNEKDTITWTLCWDLFRKQFADSRPGTKLPNKESFVKYMKQLYDEPNGKRGKWTHKMIKSDEEDSDDDDLNVK